MVKSIVILAAAFVTLQFAQSTSSVAIDPELRVVAVGETLLCKVVTLRDFDMSYLVDHEGVVTPDQVLELPEGGSVKVSGRLLRDIESDLANLYPSEDRSRTIHLAVKQLPGSNVRRVQVGGHVAFPMELEWRSGLNVAKALELCGGLLPVANHRRIVLMREAKAEVLNLRFEAARTMELRPGDKLLAQ